MSTHVKIAFICASLRHGSINQKLETALMIKAASLAVDATKLDLAEYDMPLYHGDLNTTEAAHDLIERLKTFDAGIL